MVFEGRGTTQQKKPDLLSGPTGRNILPVHVWQKKNLFWNKKCKQKKVRFFCQTWTGREDHDNRFPFFVSKRFAFFVKLFLSGLRFSKAKLVSLPVPAFFCLFLPFFLKKSDEKGWKRMKKDEKVRKPWYLTCPAVFVRRDIIVGSKGSNHETVCKNYYISSNLLDTQEI